MLVLAVLRHDQRAADPAGGNDNSRNPRVIDDDPHISANWFRVRCWYPARAAANLGWSPRITTSPPATKPP